jgi:hypothetical protein
MPSAPRDVDARNAFSLAAQNSHAIARDQIDVGGSERDDDVGAAHRTYAVVRTDAGSCGRHLAPRANVNSGV